MKLWLWILIGWLVVDVAGLLWLWWLSKRAPLAPPAEDEAVDRREDP